MKIHNPARLAVALALGLLLAVVLNWLGVPFWWRVTLYLLAGFAFGVAEHYWDRRES